MKKWLLGIILGCFVTITTSSIALAWWLHPAPVTVTNTVVTTFIINNHSSDIYCEGNVYGKTIYNTVLYQWGAGVIHPGEGVTLRVFTIPQVPFKHGWSRIKCREL